ncbi:MAG: DUF975 family protein [Oscillospiraceae bacterium]|nr:DUF975 family protein [Oscillospiraceae bacterium]
MWTRQELKSNAWGLLKNFYWKGVLAALILLFFTGGLSTGAAGSRDRTEKLEDLFDQYSSSEDSDRYDFDIDEYFEEHGFEREKKFVNNDISIVASEAETAAKTTTDTAAHYEEAIAAFTAIMGVIILIAVVLGVIWAVFVSNIVLVGHRRFHIDARYGDYTVSNVFSIFSGGHYKNVAYTMFLYDLKIFLWSLLFVIPGIIKSYEYALVPYLMADEPSMSPDRAFEISKKTMEGEKMNLFVLQLSFIGWAILASIVPFGAVFLTPYTSATYTEFYICMKAKAMANGYAMPGELPVDGPRTSPYSAPGYGNTTYGNTYGGNAYGNATYGGQSYGQPNAGQPYGGQSYGQPNAGQPYGGQSYGQPNAGQPYGGAPYGQPNAGQPYGNAPYGNATYGSGPNTGYDPNAQAPFGSDKKMDDISFGGAPYTGQQNVHPYDPNAQAPFAQDNKMDDISIDDVSSIYGDDPAPGTDDNGITN